MLSNKVYDILKWVTTIFLPALSVLYFGLAKIWNLPYADSVSATIAVVVVFLGAMLQISNATYKAMRGYTE